MNSCADSQTPRSQPSVEIFRLVMKYRTPNNANARGNWLTVMREKHKAQDALRRGVTLGMSTKTDNMLPADKKKEIEKCR